MKQRKNYIYRIMVEDATGALCNAFLCLNFAAAVAAYLKFYRSAPYISIKVLRYSFVGSWCAWTAFKDFTPIVINYLKRKNLLYEQGKTKKDC